MNKNETLNISLYILILFFIITSEANIPKTIVLPIYNASPNEPNQFEVKSIIDFYSKNDIYTSIKMGTPPLDLVILLDEEDSGFYIKEGKCISGSEYKITKSDSFSSGEGFIYQYMNNELTVLLNNTNDKIFLNQASKEYFYLSLKHRRFEENLTRIEIDNFNFLYKPNSDEIRRIEEKLNEKRKKGNEEEKTNKNKDKNNDNQNNKKNDKKKDNYGEDYYPDYYDFYGEEEDDYIGQSGFDPYYPKDDDDDYNDYDPWNEIYTENKKCGYLGLLPPGMNTALTNSKISFIQQLKNKGIIDNYNWYIRFNKDKTGELVIGAAPHEIKPENYLESDLYMTHATLINDVFYWEIKFSAIYINDIISNKKYNLKSNKGLLSINENFIYSTKEYFNNITSLYFEQYFNNKKCKIETIQKTYDRYFVIYCHQNFTLEDLQKFPILSFQSNDLNFIFDFDYNDLFLKTKGKYIFKIIYGGDFGYWKLGKTFFEKYQFVFNYDSKMFGFYQKFIPENLDDAQISDNNNQENKNDKLPPSKRKEIREKNKQLLNEKKEYGKIIIIIILIILSLMLGIYILRRFIFKNQINSKIIENYGKFQTNSTKNKIKKLTEEYSNEDNI